MTPDSTRDARPSPADATAREAGGADVNMSAAGDDARPLDSNAGDDARPLDPYARVAWLAAGWGIYLLGGPGVVTTGGSALGLLGFALLAATWARPGARAKRVEWLVGSVALGLQLTWIGYVFWPTLPYIFLGAGAYGLLGAVLVRRLATALPLGLAAGLGWIGAETLRAAVPPPFGMGWLRAGHYFQLVPEVLGSARVWGVVGLGFCGVAAAGALAGVALGRRGILRPRWGAWGVVAGLAPLALAPVLARVVPAPETRTGPRLLLVQPGFEQARKQSAGTSEELFRDQVLLTAEGIGAEARAGHAQPDLVCWGETMLGVPLVEPGFAQRVADAAAAGGAYEVEVAPWMRLGDEPLAGWYELFAQHLRTRVDLVLFRQVLPRGTAFLTGAERHVEADGALRRQNTIALWSTDGELVGISEKQHLAPGGETMLGAERFQLVRDVIHALAGYVPDFLAGEETSVLPLVTRDGAEYALSATACFDNAFVDVYLDPVAREPVDLHVVVSNEAWFQRSQEYDQMLAFSRLAAVMSGRAIVRATNGGVSAAYDAAGRELARLVVDGEDRLVRGTLALDVPVPVDRAAVPPFARSHRAWRWGACLLPLALAIVLSARKRNSLRRAG